MKYCIVGAGGAGREAFESLEQILSSRGMDPLSEICFLETDGVVRNAEVMGVPVMGLDAFDPEKYQVVIAIGNPTVREKVVAQLPTATQYFTLVDPSAVVSKYAILGAGTIIGAGVVINCNVKLGLHSRIDINSTLSHDIEAGDFFTTAPGGHVCGTCRIGDRVYLGAGAVIRQGIQLGDDVTIGMGGVVVKDIMEAGTYVGVPVTRMGK